MPIDSQNLYFHLVLESDDDGVVEAWSVIKTIGSAEDNLKVLASKGFIRILNEDLVAYVLDWNEHNLLRPDRMKPSVYRDLLIQIIPDVQLQEPKQRADRLKALGRPRDNHGTAEERGREERGSISADAQVELVSDSELEKPKKKSVRVDQHILDVFVEIGGKKYPTFWQRNTTYRDAAEWLHKEKGIEQIQKAMSVYRAGKELPFCPKIHSPHDLQTKWEKLLDFKEENRL